METSPVHHDTFQAITLRNNTIWGTILLIKTCLKSNSPRARLTIAWIILASLFVLLVPTWLSAMTGYTADISPFVEDQNGRLVKWDDFKPVIYTICDGARLQNGFNDDARLTLPLVGSVDTMDPKQRLGMDLWTICGSLPELRADGRLEFGDYDQTNECKWIWAISHYVSEYGLLGNSTEVNSTLQMPNASLITTPTAFQPPLTITVNYFGYVPDDVAFEDWSWFPVGAFWRNPHDGLRTFNVSDGRYFDQSSKTSYTIAQMSEFGQCQQTDTSKYQWGFSFYLLFVFVITLLVWTIGMWVFYLDSWLHSRLDANHRDMGLERAALDIAHALQYRISLDGYRPTGNGQIRRVAKGMQYQYTDLVSETPSSTRWNQCLLWRSTVQRRDVLHWFSREKWWLFYLCCFTGLFLMSWFSIIGMAWNPWTSILPVLGVFGVLVVGRQVRGRWSIFALTFLAFAITDAVFIPLTMDRYLYWYSGGFGLPYIHGGVDMDPEGVF